MYLNKLYYRRKNQVVHGFMDFVVYKENEIIIVDFKTDTVNSEQELVELYTIKLQTYKQAMKKITDLPIKTIYLLFFSIKVIYFRITYATMVKSLKKEGEIVEKFFKLNEKVQTLRQSLLLVLQHSWPWPTFLGLTLLF